VTAVAAPLLGRYLAATFRGGKAPGDRYLPPYRAPRLPGHRQSTPRTAGPGGPTRWRCWPSGSCPHCSCTRSSGSRACCRAIRPMPRGCRRCSRSTPPSASSPAPTGRPTPVRPRRATWPRWRAGRRPVHRGRRRAVGGPGRRPRHRREVPHDRQLLGRPHPQPGAGLRPLSILARWSW
jgi:hypothetical protein